jgi:hypothetical protein
MGSQLDRHTTTEPTGGAGNDKSLARDILLIAGLKLSGCCAPAELKNGVEKQQRQKLVR